jgi:alkyldihydroxyacetonephosphate synthase
MAGREPRGAPGPDWVQLFLGSEGTLGVITRATLRVRPAPEVRLLRGWAFPRVGAGAAAIRAVLQRGLRPAVVRLYDQADTLVHRSSGHPRAEADLAEALAGETDLERRVAGARGWLLRTALGHPRLLNRALDVAAPRLGGGCLLIIGFEGDRELTEAEAACAKAELERAGGRDLGERPGLRWLENRYKISFQQSKVFENGGFVDTMEVAATWDRLLDVYHAVREAVTPHALVLAHFSHAYPDGCSIYFTFTSAGRDRADAERRYDTIWRRGLSAVLAAGGTLSHHHGVGMSKQKYLPEELGVGMDLLRALKQALDPAGILNPGKLGLGDRA